MKTKRSLLTLLALILAIGMFPLTASAGSLQVVDDGSDTMVYAGGIYDLKVKAIGGTGDVTYTWQIGLGNGESGWSSGWHTITQYLDNWADTYSFESEIPSYGGQAHLMNNLRMDTAFFEDNGEDKTSDWHEIQFRCVAEDKEGNKGTSQVYNMYVYSYDAMKKRVNQENAFQMLTEPSGTEITREVGQAVDFTIHTNEFPEWMTDSEVRTDQYFEITDSSGTNTTKGDGGYHYSLNRYSPCTLTVVSHADLYCGPNLIKSASKTYTVTFQAKEETKQTADRVIFTLDTPVDGAKPPTTLWCVGANVKSLTWLRKEITERGIEDWEKMPSTASFKEGKRYMAEIVFTPDTGYEFAPKSDLKLTLTNNNYVNGSLAELTPDKLTVRVEFEATANNPFVDVAKSDYFYDAVIWAVKQGITKGTDATHFSPADPCTRAQVVTFLHRAKGSPEPSSTVNPFSDVTSSDYFYKPVLWAVEKGITNGVNPGYFGANDTCTRGQVVTFLWRAEGSPKPSSSVNPFTDVTSSDYFYEPVLWAVEKGITKGTSDKTFGPEDPCNRGQIVTFLYRDLG